MIQWSNHGKPERVDATTIVEEVDVITLLTASCAHTAARESSTRAKTSSGSGHAVAPSEQQRRTAPAVDRELDVAPGQPFSL